MQPTTTPSPRTSFRERFATLVTDIGKSCYDVERYRAFRQRPWKDALRYLAAFLGLVVVATFVTFAVVAVPVPGRIVEHLQTTLPDSITFTLAEGKLSVTGADVPLNVGTAEMPFRIDTSVEGTVSAGDVGEIDGIVIGHEAVFLVEDGATISAQPLTTLTDGSMTKSDVLTFLAENGTGAAIVAALLFAFFHALLLAVNAALLVVIGAWLSYAIGRMWRVGLSYRHWVAVGLHAVTLPILAEHLFWAMSWEVPFSFPFLYFMVMIAVLVDERQSPTANP